ncbi:hypothetical protein K3552_18055 [Leisingera aquaemixtae]|uniref:hypothetical protein n=1 Tax=Leisingera aquaemixtae TaxID=1396826 RepID=UPI0021A4D7FE|nr:hypothetical protein [Leisingera aquaemixtae]UWQ37344.1 hypothetical protein K3552_18055 [Leisingera aquaemixtae]
MTRSSKTDQSLFILATQLLRHCRTHRLMPVAEKPLDRAQVLDAVSDAVDLFEARIEAMSPKAMRGQTGSDSAPYQTISQNRFRET